jgi:hypothetical protein
MYVEPNENANEVRKNLVYLYVFLWFLKYQVYVCAN